MKNIRLYANYSDSGKILVDMSNQVFDINYRKKINFVIVDLFQLIISTPFLIWNDGGIKKQFIDTLHNALVIYATFLFCFWKASGLFHIKDILYINIYLKNHMEENLSNFIQVQYTN